MTATAPRPWTVDDFLAWKAQEPERHEFVGGVVVMMTGGSVAHGTIMGNVYAALRARLRGTPCRVIADGPKVVTAAGSFYLNVTVTRVPVSPTDDRVAEPAVVVEVLSESTASRDRGPKWDAYQHLASLRHYVLVHQDKRRVEVFGRMAAGDDRSCAAIEPPRVAALAALGLDLPLDEIYEDRGV